MENWQTTVLHPGIDLQVEHHISQQDAQRQQRTAAAILRRLTAQPGLVLADEVGMGKTFVALAVAVSVILAQRRRQPVVVMTPTGLQKKWEADFEKFCDCCMPRAPKEAGLLKQRIRIVEDGEDLFHHLGLPEEQRPWLILITHGALNRRLKDEWIKLALMRRALLHQRDSGTLGRKVARCASRLLRMQGEARRAESGEALWARLLQAPPSSWRRLLMAEGLWQNDRDPVPETLLDHLCANDFKDLRDQIRNLPQRFNGTFDDRLNNQKRELNNELQKLWREALKRQQHRLPLLILDEAHHAKNSHTDLASLFNNEITREDAEELKRGAFAGKFQRMLFLTATPFQLGHAELCQVLERFNGVFLPSAEKERAEFAARLTTLRGALDASQHQARLFETIWGTHCPATLPPDAWHAMPEVQAAFATTQQRFKEAQQELRQWIIRHTRPRELSTHFPDIDRRTRHTGDAISDGPGSTGIPVVGGAVLPFLLAARAAMMQPTERPVFAEGLSSSYESFLHTRKARDKCRDEEERVQAAPDSTPDQAAAWYLKRLDEVLSLHDPATCAAHPKIAATVARAVRLWQQGEKVVIFCHFRETGCRLRQLISRAIQQSIHARHDPRDLERMSRRFDDSKSPARHFCDAQVRQALLVHPELAEHEEALQRIARRFLGTPSYLSRCLPHGADQVDEATLQAAFEHRDSSGMSFQKVLHQFCGFLSQQCKALGRQHILEALSRVQVGHGAVDHLDDDNSHGRDRVEPNVRLVNGDTSHETRENLMLTFNSPFFPEILITSNVMAEGVDLHRFCRHVIHHDLAWNPSTLEQRTGRLDRIGCKAEQLHCGKPVQVYLPYLAATQDEKQFQVVTYRERWFGILMGEDYRADSLTADRLSARQPLPQEIIRKLRLDLSVTVTEAF